MRIYTGLRAFHYTVLSGSTTAAACALHVSQPTVSVQVKNLERSYGVQLFTKRGRNLELTELGKRLAVIADHLFKLEDEAVKILHEVKMVPDGRFLIGTTGAPELIMPIAAFLRRNANVQVTMAIEKKCNQVMHKVRDYRFEVGVVFERTSGENLSYISLGGQPLIVIAKRDHPLMNRGDLQLTDLEGQAIVAQDSESATRKAFESELRDVGVAVNTVMETTCHQSLREAVACGIGLGVMSRSTHVPDERISVLPIVDLKASTHCFMVCREDRKSHRLIADFLAACYQVRYPPIFTPS